MDFKDNMQTLHIIVKGKVQGVFFRASAKEAATRSGLSGWVRNTANGDVEISVTGNSESLDAFVTWCRTGPDKAVVKEVICQETPLQLYTGFTINK